MRMSARIRKPVRVPRDRDPSTWTPAQHRQALALALSGIRSCATRCGCCELHKQIAEEVLKDYEKLYRVY